MRLTIAYILPLCGFFSVAVTLVDARDSYLWGMFKIILPEKTIQYNPDVNLNTLEIIRKAGYPAEAHVIVTEDGYLLTLHRIPGNGNSSAVLLQHGLLSSSADWVISGKGKGLAFVLADQGYDVWLGNFRGNTYSKAHISLSPKDPRFWNFSFHEMGIYDLPAMISYITNHHFRPLHAYIGYSMGTTAFYVMAVECPQITRMVQMMVSLAPVAFMENIKSPIKYLAPFAKNYAILARFLGANEFLPHNWLMRLFAKYVCDMNMIEKKICANNIFLICGFDSQQFNYTLLPMILSHSPAGASTKTIVHYAQEIMSGRFRQYDYGSKKNMQLYNSTEPPDYDFTNVTIPITLFYADNDWLASVSSVKKLYSKLHNVVEMYRVPFPKFNHVDFIWGKDAYNLVYKKVLQVIANPPMEETEFTYDLEDIVS